MKRPFSKHWKSSTQPRKQRKYIANATLKEKHRFLCSLLSPELRQQDGKRSIPVIKEDEVKVMRGQFKDMKGKILRVFSKKSRIHVDGAQTVKRDGSKAYYPIHPSNVMIINLHLDDKERMNIFRRIKHGTPQKIENS